MKTLVRLRCDACRQSFNREASQVIHKAKTGMKHVFCSQRCTGAARRIDMDPLARKAAKREYDKQYRTLNRARIAARKAEDHRRRYDPAEARKVRQARAKWHAEYCRRYYADPKRKAAKSRYDLNRRAAEYGPFGDAFKLLLRLDRELRKRAPDKYERLKARGYYNEGGGGWLRNEIRKAKRAN